MFWEKSNDVKIIADGIKYFIDDLCTYQQSPEVYFTKDGMIDRLKGRGIEGQIASQVVAITPLVIVGIDINEIWIFGSDTRLKEKIKADKCRVYKMAKAATKNIMEITTNIQYLLPDGKGYQIKIVDIWIGGSLGIGVGPN